MVAEPKRIYIEKGCEAYALGRELIKKYGGLGTEMVAIDDHNHIPALRERPYGDFPAMKDYLVLGIRKSLTHRKNNKTSDFLVPYTSSGCSAMCLYCYLVCTYYTGSYLRIFVNREQMMKKLKNAAAKYPGSVFEIGSNSDLVLENAYSGNLEWTIREFADVRNAMLTLPTKFDMVDPLLALPHGRNVTIRMSLNPKEIISRVEFRTSSLENRIEAVNKLYRAGYGVGILVAPVVLLDGYEEMYDRLFAAMAEKLLPEIRSSVSLEIIFLTYGTVTREINSEAFPHAVQLYNGNLMSFCGRHRYGYTAETKEEASLFLKDRIADYLPEANIAYIV
ncbi:MAG: SPL family radical SAM protein [Christensenellales bacterium]